MVSRLSRSGLLIVEGRYALEVKRSYYPEVSAARREWPEQIRVSSAFALHKNFHQARTKSADDQVANGESALARSDVPIPHRRVKHRPPVVGNNSGWGVAKPNGMSWH